jgi:hypothetical protein
MQWADSSARSKSDHVNCAIVHVDARAAASVDTKSMAHWIGGTASLEEVMAGVRAQWIPCFKGGRQGLDASWASYRLRRCWGLLMVLLPGRVYILGLRRLIVLCRAVFFCVEALTGHLEGSKRYVFVAR